MEILDQNKFDRILKEKTLAVDLLVTSFLPEAGGYQRTVMEAMNYSLSAGGKRLRPLLMQETYSMLGGSGREISPFMAAIEMIHTYSLVHDDLPAMDNDEYRRGRKTTHVVYGEAMGILAGDALLNYAFETALLAFSAEYRPDFKSDADRADWQTSAVRAMGILAGKAGIHGMIGGQTADIEAETQNREVSGEQLLFIHEHKTAALIQAAMMIGAVLAGASDRDIEKIEKCATNIGVAFQIQDDILDVTGSSEVLGKQVGSDEKNHKQTYVTIMGLERSREDVRILSEEAASILDSFDGDHIFLKQLLLQLINRSS